jgi:hypothetical protein
VLLVTARSEVVPTQVSTQGSRSGFLSAPGKPQSCRFEVFVAATNIVAAVHLAM